MNYKYKKKCLSFINTFIKLHNIYHRDGIPFTFAWYFGTMQHLLLITAINRLSPDYLIGNVKLSINITIYLKKKVVNILCE